MRTDYEIQLRKLEMDHVQSQPFALKHFSVHWQIFVLALGQRDLREVLGQIPRLILAAPSSLLGLAPRGNVGTTRMGIFESTDKGFK